MATILIPTRVRYGFTGGVGEVIRLLGAVSSASGHRLIDLDGAPIPVRLPSRSRQPKRVLARRLSFVKSLFFFELAFPRADLVFFQTSLNRNALFRDLAYMRKCHQMERPFSVFFHGWNQELAGRLSASPRRSHKLAELLNHAQTIFVLAPGFRDVLASWGVIGEKMIVETTMIDDTILWGFDVEDKIRERNPTRGLKILFMSRIVREKGIYQAIDAFRLHRTRFPASRLVIAGDGAELNAVKDKVHRESIEGVRFTGFVDGVEKVALLADAEAFLFPSFYGEGLPVALLEAMAFGSTVVTRPVGGISNFLRVPEMGRLEPGLEPERYALILNEVAANPEAWAATARVNHEFSLKNTLASQVCGRILREVTKTFGSESAD